MNAIGIKSYQDLPDHPRANDVDMDCVVCGEYVEDYEPEPCCSGEDCGCNGKPVEPPICSERCHEAWVEMGGE